MVLGSGVFERLFELGEVIKMEPSRMRLVPLSGRDCFSSLYSLPHEGTVGSQKSAARKWPCLHSDLGFSFRNCEEYSSVVYKAPSVWYFVIAVQAKTWPLDYLHLVLLVLSSYYASSYGFHAVWILVQAQYKGSVGHRSSWEAGLHHCL